jgi:predicted DNA-binding protein with PD1-like motif
LSKVYLRFANQHEWACYDGKHEIVSLTGTLSRHGAHLHMSVSNPSGTTIGGHVVDGSTIYTTAEIVIARLDSLVFLRKLCPLSGFEELVVDSRTEEH